MNISKPYLLSLYSETSGCKNFFDSITGDLEHVRVKFEKYPGHIEKWKHVPRDLDPERYLVFSDTDDVIFQAELPEFTHDLYLAPENVTHRHTMWKEHIEKYPVFSELMDVGVLNCGTFAMKVKHVYEYVDFMMNLEDGGYRSMGFEQLYFNLFVNSRKDLSKVYDRSIFCPLFANVHHGVEKRDGVWVDGDKVVSVVHANGDLFLKREL